MLPKEEIDDIERVLKKKYGINSEIGLNPDEIKSHQVKKVAMKRELKETIKKRIIEKVEHEKEKLKNASRNNSNAKRL